MVHAITIGYAYAINARGGRLEKVRGCTRKSIFN